MYEEVNLAIIGSGNGLSPVCMCQAITCTIQYTLKKGLNEIRIKLQSFFCVFSRKHIWKCHLGAVSIRKTVLPGMGIPMLKIRRPNGRLIFNMEIAIRR